VRLQIVDAKVVFFFYSRKFLCLKIKNSPQYGRKMGNFLHFLFAYPSTIASEGQTSAHVPQDEHFSGSIL
jgi:hypothetical protein